MRNALGIDKGTDILDHCHSLAPNEEAVALEKIRTIEREAMVSQQPQPGIIPLMEYIDSKKIPRGICTRYEFSPSRPSFLQTQIANTPQRNFDAPVNHLLTKFLPEFEFAPGKYTENRPKSSSEER